MQQTVAPGEPILRLRFETFEGPVFLDASHVAKLTLYGLKSVRIAGRAVEGLLLTENSAWERVET